MNTIEVGWADSEQSILCYRFQRGWSWSDIFTALRKGSEMVASTEQRVDVIMDLSQANTVPSGAISQLRHSYNNAKVSNLGVTVLVGTNVFWEKLIEVTNRMAGAIADKWQLKFAQDVGEATQLIYRLRTEVPKPR